MFSNIMAMFNNTMKGTKDKVNDRWHAASVGGMVGEAVGEEVQH